MVLGSHGKPISTYSTVKDGVVKVEGFEAWDDKEVMSPDMTSDKEGENSLKENFYGEQQEETTETDTQPCEKINNGEDIDTYQSMCKRSEAAQRNFASSGTKVVKELRAFKSLFFNTCVSDKSCKIADEESSTKTMQQRAIPDGVVGVVLLVSGIVSYIIKVHTIGAVGVIAGLACISFALYSTLEPSTKLEKVEQLLQSSARKHS